MVYNARRARYPLRLLRSASSLNLSYDKLLSVNNLVVLKLEILYLNLLAETEGGNVNYYAVREVGIDTIHFEFTHLERELTTGFYALSQTLELHGNLNGYRLLFGYLEEINVEEDLLNGVELKLFNNAHVLFTCYGELYYLGVRRVDEFAYIVYRYGEGEVLTIAIEIAGNELLLAESLSCLLAEVIAKLAREFKYFHCK